MVPFQLASGPTGLSRIGENLPGSISERHMFPERIRADSPSAETGFCGAEKGLPSRFRRRQSGENQLSMNGMGAARGKKPSADGTLAERTPETQVDGLSVRTAQRQKKSLFQRKRELTGPRPGCIMTVIGTPRLESFFAEVKEVVCWEQTASPFLLQ